MQLAVWKYTALSALDGRRQATGSPAPTSIASYPISACSQCCVFGAASPSWLLPGVF